MTFPMFGNPELQRSPWISRMLCFLKERKKRGRCAGVTIWRNPCLFCFVPSVASTRFLLGSHRGGGGTNSVLVWRGGEDGERIRCGPAAPFSNLRLKKNQPRLPLQSQRHGAGSQIRSKPKRGRIRCGGKQRRQQQGLPREAKDAVLPPPRPQQPYAGKGIFHPS